ncbi:MAG: RNA 2',3'-cyclic phosphodiesterase [Acidiferrobacterales bacterium]
MHEANIRLFLALWPGKSEQERLHAIAHQHRPTGKCRLTAAHGLHLTLLFLGSVSPVTESCVRAITDTIYWRPFEIEFDRLGWFAQPRVMWVGCSELPAQLLSLVEGLQTGLAQCGFEPERRDFYPHITVARKVTRPPKVKEIEPITCYFDSVVLVESRTEQQGVEYVALASWPAQTS